MTRAQMTAPVMAAFAAAVMDRAVELLEAEADGIQEAYTDPAAPDDWTGEEEAQVRHDNLRASARELRALLVQLQGPGRRRVRVDRGDDGKGLLERAIDVVRQDGGASVDGLKRALRITGPRAVRLAAELEAEGVLGSANDDGYREARTA